LAGSGAGAATQPVIGYLSSLVEVAEALANPAPNISVNQRIRK
jgi:hypothetical protein